VVENDTTNDRDKTMNAILTKTQRNALDTLARCNGSEIGIKPRGCRSDTIQVLVRLGLVDRKWHTVGRIETLRVTDAGLAAVSEMEVSR
jgi:hypothetical protein